MSTEKSDILKRYNLFRVQHAKWHHREKDFRVTTHP